MVNDLIFGFPSIDMYDEYINLLLKIRTPKLSNSYKPSTLRNVLSSVLQPLSEEELRPMTEAIESMNKSKETLEELEKTKKSLLYLKKYFDEYNQVVLYQKAKRFLTFNDEYMRVLESDELTKKDLQENEILLSSKKTENDNLEVEKSTLEHKKNSLDESDLKQVVEKVEELKTNLEKVTIKHQQKVTKKEEKEDSKISINNQITKLSNETDALLKEMTSSISLLKSMESDIYLTDTSYYIEDIEDNLTTYYDYSPFKKIIEDYNVKLNNIYKRLEEIDLLIKEKDKLMFEYDEISNNIEDLKEKINDAKEKLLVEFSTYQEYIINFDANNKELKLNDESIKKLFDELTNYSEDTPLNINLCIQKCYQEQQESLLKTSLQIKNKLELNAKEYDELEEKLKVCLTTNILEKENSHEVLIEKNIPFLPLYKAISFKSNVSLETSKQIESAFYDLGIIDALITSPTNYDIVSKTSEKFLVAGEKLKNNVLTYFDITPSDTITKETIISVLEGIGTNTEGTIYINQNGEYKSSVIKGNAIKNYELRFIGESVREKYRIEQINKIKDEEKELNVIKGNLERRLSDISSRLDLLVTEKESFKLPNTIIDIIGNINKLGLNNEFLNKQKDILYDKLNLENEKIKDLESNIKEFIKGLYVPCNKETIKNVIINLEIYKKSVDELSKNHTSLLMKNEQKMSFTIQKEELEQDIDILDCEIIDITNETNLITGKINNYNNIMQDEKFKNMQEELTLCIHRLNEIDHKLLTLAKEMGQIENEIKNEHGLIESRKEIIIKCNNKLSVAKIIFEEELNLKYVFISELKESFDIAKQICKEIDIKNTTSEITLGKFHEAYNKVGISLNSYRPNFEVLFEIKTDSLDEEIKSLYIDAKRTTIMFTYSNKKVTLQELFKEIDDSLLLYSELLKEEDRKLFQDILINNVGSSIRKRIYDSEEWIKKIKVLMESMNTSSGLSFSIAWKGKDGTTEDEADTKDIVDILKRDPKTLRSEDYEKITKHFRSKIKRVEESLEDKDKYFYDLIFNVLDYRNWFEFVLYYKRVGVDKKELTDKDFSKFSGGEKGISMYIPLFSSIYAKYQSARPNSLRIIALDEAFAGVDDANIRDCFRILSSLNLDYIMTSQSLWGDYDTVKALAIAELIRPLNAQAVSIAEYRWNGHIRKLITRTELDE
ncbi:MAG: SbcC/MukB-like Walker B domain-containing protein [Bacilli bacterium]